MDSREQHLIEGRIVHYVLDRGSSAGQCRPAIVVKIWSQAQGSVQLQVFTDADNDSLPAVLWATSVTYSEDPQPRTWHWPRLHSA